MTVSEARVREHLVELGMGEALKDVADDESLLLSNVLDSVGMIDLIAELERVYDVSISEDEMTPEHFETISSIAEFVSLKSSHR